SGSLAVTANSTLCPFQIPNSSSSFITISAATWDRGSGSVDYSVEPSGGTSRKGTLDIAGNSFTITEGQPEVSSNNSVSGARVAHTFSFTFTDPDGWQDFGVVNVLINRALDGRNACYLAYDRPSSMLYLVSDIGGGLNGIPLNGSGSLSNSQCTVNGAGSFAT